MNNEKIDSIDQHKVERLIKKDFITFINAIRKNKLLDIKDVEVVVDIDNYSVTSIPQQSINITRWHTINIVIILFSNSDTVLELTIDYKTGEILFIRVSLYGKATKLYTQLNKYVNTLPLRIKNKSLILV